MAPSAAWHSQPSACARRMLHFHLYPRPPTHWCMTPACAQCQTPAAPPAKPTPKTADPRYTLPYTANRQPSAPPTCVYSVCNPGSTTTGGRQPGHQLIHSHTRPCPPVCTLCLLPALPTPTTRDIPVHPTRTPLTANAPTCVYAVSVASGATSGGRQLDTERCTASEGVPSTPSSMSSAAARLGSAGGRWRAMVPSSTTTPGREGRIGWVSE